MREQWPLHGDNAYQRSFQAAANSLAAWKWVVDIRAFQYSLERIILANARIIHSRLCWNLLLSSGVFSKCDRQTKVHVCGRVISARRVWKTMNINFVYVCRSTVELSSLLMWYRPINGHDVRSRIDSDAGIAARGRRWHEGDGTLWSLLCSLN